MWRKKDRIDSLDERHFACLGPLDVRLKMPTSAVLIGPSGSGKTTFMDRLLKLGKEDVCDFYDDSRAFGNRVVLYYNLYQPLYSEWKELGLVDEFISVSRDGLPSETTLSDMAAPYRTNGGIVIIFDDLKFFTPALESLFGVHRQHNVISTFVLAQELPTSSSKDLHYKAMCKNAQVLILFRCFKNNKGVKMFGGHFEDVDDGDYDEDEEEEEMNLPGRRKKKKTKRKRQNYFYEAYRAAMMENPRYGYLFYDASQECPELLRARTNVLPDPASGKICQRVFIRKNAIRKNEGRMRRSEDPL